MSRKIGEYKILLVLLLVHLFLLVNLLFTAWPEMLFWPYLILKGWLPYTDIAIAHNPLLLIDLSIFYSIFGIGIVQLKAYTWITILAIDLVLFWTTKKFWDKKTALYALSAYIPLQLYYEGNGLWFDLTLAFVALCVYFFVKKRNYLWTGIFWALAYLTKQTAIWFLLGIAFSAWQQSSQKLIVLKQESSRFLKGLLVVFVPTAAILTILGIEKDFFIWALEFGISVLPRAAGQVALPTVRQLFLALLPFSVFLFLLVSKRKNTRRDGLELLAWSVAGLLGAFPRWGLFHFQPALPYLAIGIGLVFASRGKLKPIFKYSFIVYLVIISFLIIPKFVNGWGGKVRFNEAEVVQIAQEIKKQTSPNEMVYVLNAWDNLYALSDTLPATRPWIPHLAWYMELDGVQEGIVFDLDKVRPKLIVMQSFTETGLGSYIPDKIDEYIFLNYEIKDKIGGYLFLTPKQ